MTSKDEMVSDEELVSQLSHRPYEVHHGMIRLAEVPKSTPFRTKEGSTIGILDKLPPEVFHHILDWLDFLSLCRISVASTRMNSIVHSHPAYRDVFLHAPSALAALGRTRLITQHPAGLIRSTLRSPQCLYCHNFGAYLFLPTCERCCWHCLENNSSLWVVSRGVAGRCFGLSSAELDQLPLFLSIPGEYCVGHEPTMRTDRQKLVSVKAVKELACSIHGSEEEVYRTLTRIPRIADKRRAQYKHYHSAQLEPPRIDASTRSASKLEATAVHDPFPGMGSITFPAVTPKGVESGLWCRGCDELLKTHAMRFFPTHSQPVPMWTLFVSMRRRSYTRSQFLQHIKICCGIRQVAARSGLEAWSQHVHKADATPRTLSEVVSSLLAASCANGEADEEKRVDV